MDDQDQSPIERAATQALDTVRKLPERIQQAQTASVQQHPARAYPDVMPTWPSGTAFAVSVCAFLIGIGLIVGGWMLHQSEVRKARLLQSEGITVQAHVVDKRIHKSKNSRSYSISYAFTADKDSQRSEFRRSDSVPRHLYDEVEKGDTIEIVYARSDPNITKIRALYTPGEVPYAAQLFLGIGGIFSLVLTIFIFRHYRQAGRLDAEGIPASVRVLDLYVHKGSKSTSFYIGYDLPGVGPIRHTINKATYERLQVGDIIQIVQLQDEPKVFRMA